MKSILFWKLLFLHYMCLSENQRMQGNIEDHHSQSPPPSEAETEKHPDKDLDLGYNPKTAHSVMRQSLCSDVYAYAFAGAVLGKSQRMKGDQGLEQKSCQGNWRCQNLRVKL